MRECHEEERGLSNRNNGGGKFKYVANNVHRIHLLDTKTSKNSELYIWIAHELNEHWRLGVSLMIEQLRQTVSNKYPCMDELKRSNYSRCSLTSFFGGVEFRK